MAKHRRLERSVQKSQKVAASATAVAAQTFRWRSPIKDELVSIRQIETMARLAGCEVVCDIGPYDIGFNRCQVTLLLESSTGSETFTVDGPRELRDDPKDHRFCSRPTVKKMLVQAGGNISKLTS